MTRQRPSASESQPAGPSKPGDIVDRDQVWQTLVEAWRSDEPELLVGLGRRRAGKSWVLARFARSVGGLYYQATKRTEADQLAVLSRIVGEHHGDPALTQGVPFPDWEALFAYLTQRAGGKAFLLVIDEFPYLAEAAPALPSILQSTWDHPWSTSKAKVVLNGSHITAMKRLEEADQPLYGRRTRRLTFPPFAAHDVRAFVPGYSVRDIFRVYGIVGGLPGHLGLLRPDQDLEANVSRLLLDPDGRLADEAEHMLDAFLGDADVHYSILQAIAQGERKWNRISSRLGKPSGSLSRPMRWLEDMHLVKRLVPVTENPKTSKRTLYSLSDPYVGFWHRFIAPLRATGELSLATPQALWQGRIEPGLDAYMGPVFEDACRAWVARARELPFRPSRLGAWWDATSENEIDVVALGPTNEVLVGTCKWGAVSDRDLRALRETAARLIPELPSSHRSGAITWACFSALGEWGAGVADEIEAGSVLGFTGKDLLSR
ncbi:MAG: ATP-binding protein [Gemmatimonadales bacterium]|nr:MAG: ATP-binding protein [Gemmatimonadales bacterium]